MHQDKSYQWKTVRNAIADLEFDKGECATLSEERLKFLKMIPEGGNWRDLPENIIPIAMGGAYKSGGGKVGFYRRLSYDQPSPTVVTSPVQKATMMCHPTQDRPLSIKEYARIQQFRMIGFLLEQRLQNIVRLEMQCLSDLQKQLARRFAQLQTGTQL